MSRTTPTLREVLARLRPADRTVDAAAARALLRADDDGAEQRTPWFVRAMVAAGAWISSLFLVAFLFGSRLLGSVGGSMVAGGAILAGAVLLRRGKTQSPFLVQFALALSFTGQALFFSGMGQRLGGEAGALAALAVSVALVLLYPDKSHRFLSTLVAAGGAVVFVYAARLPYGLQALAIGLAAAGGHLWFHESRLCTGSLEPMVRPVAYGLIVALFGILVPSVITSELNRRFGMAPGWGATTIALTVLLLLLEYRLLAYHGALGRVGTTALLFGGTMALAAASLKAPGIMAALFVLLTGFHRGNRIVIGLSLAFLAVFLSAYYYAMQITLLTKSYALLASGVVLLLLRPFVVKALGAGEGEAARA